MAIASPSTMSRALDDLSLSIFEARSKKFIDNFSVKNPLTEVMDRHGGIVRWTEGGDFYPVSLDYAAYRGAVGISQGDTVLPDNQQTLTENRFDFKECAFPLGRTRAELTKRHGANSVYEYFKRKIDKSNQALDNLIEVWLLGSATGIGTVEWMGIQHAIPKVVTSGKLGLLDRATDLWYRSIVKTSSGEALVNLRTEMEMVYDKATNDGSYPPHVIMTHNDVWWDAEGSVSEQFNYQSAKAAELTIPEIHFHGVPMRKSSRLPRGEMRFINCDHYKFVFDSFMERAMTDWKEYPDSPFDQVAQIVVRATSAVDEPRRLGCLHGITTSTTS